jgi:hypothetical protein
MVQIVETFAFSGILFFLYTKIFGGKEGFETYLLILLYYFGVAIVLFGFCLVIGIGILNLSGGTEVEASICVSTVPCGLWLLLGWGVYRRVNQISGFRRTLAFLCSYPIGMTLLGVSFLVISGLFFGAPK